MSIQLTTGILQQIKNRGSVGGEFLLDTYTGAAAAYSLRKLKTGVTSVVRVRRSSDNVEADFTASEITNGTLTTWTGANDGFVTTLYDQSGNSNHAAQTTTTKQSKIVSAGVVILEAGLPCLNFASNGTNSYTFTTRLTAIRSVFILQKASDNSTSSTCFLLGDVSEFNYISGTSGTYLRNGTALPDVLNGQNRLNGVLTDLDTTPRSLFRTLVSMIHTGPAVASRISDDRGNNGRSYRGTAQEVIIYESDQTALRADIETAINAYYGIY